MPRAALPLPEPPLTDGVVSLRPWCDTHVTEVATWGHDPEIVRWSGVPVDQTADTARAFFARTEQARQAGLMVALAIADTESDRVLGSCDVRRPDPLDFAIGELGYVLVANARGRGVATRTVRLLTEWSFGELAMQRVQALVHPENPASARVLERVGFQREGLLRSYRAASRGREDRVIYAILPSELADR
ncbi:MAG TPA: GNAT family protein [Solirubrobacteraceae bacterium]